MQGLRDVPRSWKCLFAPGNTGIPCAGKRGWEQAAPGVEQERWKMEIGVQFPSCLVVQKWLLACPDPLSIAPSMESTWGLPGRQRWEGSTGTFLSPCHWSVVLTPHARESRMLQDPGLSCRQEQPEISWNVLIPNRKQQIVQRQRSHPLGCCYKLVFPEFWDFSRSVMPHSSSSCLELMSLMPPKSYDPKV